MIIFVYKQIAITNVKLKNNLHLFTIQAVTTCWEYKCETVFFSLKRLIHVSLLFITEVKEANFDEQVDTVARLQFIKTGLVL